MRGLVALSVFSLATACLAAEQTARPDIAFSPIQESVLLKANKITAAAERCDFKIDDSTLSTLLNKAGVVFRDMEVKKQSQSLRDEVSSYVKSFKDNKEKVCSEALVEYGKDGRQGHFLLE